MKLSKKTKLYVLIGCVSFGVLTFLFYSLGLEKYLTWGEEKEITMEKPTE